MIWNQNNNFSKIIVADETKQNNSWSTQLETTEQAWLGFKSKSVNRLRPEPSETYKDNHKVGLLSADEHF